MFNHFIITNANKKFRKITQQERKNEQWTKRYKTEVRPNLLSKHERRIQGFAKKMQCEPVVLTQPEEQMKRSVIKMGTNSDRKLKFVQDKKSYFTSRRLKTDNSIYKIQKIENLKQAIAKKYINPSQSFRQRQKIKEIHPPMKYGNKNSKLILAAVSARNAIKKEQAQIQTRPRNHSRSSIRSNYDSDYNYSDFDIMTIKQTYLQQRAQNFRTQKQIRQQQQLKALSHDRLYFKSLIDFEQKMKDKTIKQNLRKILVKCKIFKQGMQRKTEQAEHDQFAEMMKLMIKEQS